MALRLLHLADVHFGMENYGRLDAATGLNRRLPDFARSVHYAIDYALEHGVHLAIFAGVFYSAMGHVEDEALAQKTHANIADLFGDR